MRQYETAFLIAPNLPEEEIQTLIQDMAKVVSKDKGKLINQDFWGKRKLAYPIRKFSEAYYAFFLYESSPSTPAELERQLKQKDAVLRYMTILKEARDNVRMKSKKVSSREEKLLDEETPESLETEPAPENTEEEEQK